MAVHARIDKIVATAINEPQDKFEYVIFFHDPATPSVILAAVLNDVENNDWYDPKFIDAVSDAYDFDDL